MKQRLSDREGTMRFSSLQPLWEAIIKYVASLFELQRKDVERNTKKRKERKRKQKNKSYISNMQGKFFQKVKFLIVSWLDVIFW